MIFKMLKFLIIIFKYIFSLGLYFFYAFAMITGIKMYPSAYSGVMVILIGGLFIIEFLLIILSEIYRIKSETKVFGVKYEYKKKRLDKVFMLLISIIPAIVFSYISIVNHSPVISIIFLWIFVLSGIYLINKYRYSKEKFQFNNVRLAMIKLTIPIYLAIILIGVILLKFGINIFNFKL